MIDVVLKFPDVIRFGQFILLHKVKDAEVYSTQFALRAFLPEEEIAVACKEYGALADHTSPEAFSGMNRSLMLRNNGARRSAGVDPLTKGGSLNEHR